ncbi:hypothetical protein MMC07_008023 [Pseudocyphellaria aurata]|nr:hypothetical protein [Pseudocyphellaria aurata]
MQPHPVLLLVAEIFFIVIATGFTSPSSIVRLFLLPIVAMCSWVAVLTSLEKLHRTPWAAFVGGHSITFLLQYISIALLSRWSFMTSGPSAGMSQDLQRGRDSTEKQKPGDGKNNVSGTLGARLKFGFLAATSFRHSSTPYEVKNVPHFSSHDPNYIPSKTEFLRRKAITVLVCFLVLDVLSLGADPETNSLGCSPEKIPLLTRLGEVTGHELVWRLLVTLGFGIGVLSIQTGAQSIVALVDVGLGFNSVESWRPLFGSPGEAYTLRRYWSIFWHQNNRSKVCDLVNFLLLPLHHQSSPSKYSRSTLTKYLNFSLHFFIEGLLHAGTDMAAGVPWHESGATRFFLTQVVGIALEEGVQYCYRAAFSSGPSDRPHMVTRPRTRPRTSSWPWWKRIGGYIWVILFLAWSVPGWVYPTMHRLRSGSSDAILPFSIISIFI